MEPRPPSARLLTLETLPLMFQPASEQVTLVPASSRAESVTWPQCCLRRGGYDGCQVLLGLYGGREVVGLAGVVAVLAPDDAHHSPVVVAGAPHQQSPGARVSPGDAGQSASFVNLTTPTCDHLRHVTSISPSPTSSDCRQRSSPAPPSGPGGSSPRCTCGSQPRSWSSQLAGTTSWP